MKIIYTAIILILLLNMGIVYGQLPPSSDGDDSSKIPPKYYKIFKEHFYKEDEPLQEINESEVKEEESFFVARYNEKNKLLSIGYYQKTGESKAEQTLSLTQYVNIDGIPYYYVTYTYNNKDQLVKKEYKDQNDKLIAYHKYSWHDRTNLLVKVEKFGKTSFLGKMELKSYNKYTWESESKLKTFTFYGKNLLPIEKYYLNVNPDTGENKSPNYLVGNNKISMFVLSKYERFRVGSKKEKRQYYVTYEQKDNLLFQKKYNHDDVLVEEKPPINIPQREEADVPPPTDS